MEILALILLIIIIYAVGCILAYGRLFAIFYNIDKKFIKYIPPSDIKSDTSILIMCLFSWIALLAGIIMYFIEKEGGQHFFKYSNEDLWEIYNEYNN